MAIESMNYLAEKAKQDALIKQQKQEKVSARNQEKNLKKQESKNASKDYVTTLNIEGKNAGFKEKAGFFRSMADNAKTLWGGIKEKWSKRNEMVRVVPEESTTKARYEAALQRGEQSVEKVSAQAEQLAVMGENLAAQKQEITELGDMWASQHEGQYETSRVESENANAVAEHTVEAGDEWNNSYKDNRADAGEAENESVGSTENLPAEKTSGQAFAEYANQTEEFSQLAQIIRRVNPLKEGNGALASALESGQMNSDQKKLVRGALKQLTEMPNWGKNDKQVFEAVTNQLDLDERRAAAPTQEGVGDVLESHAENLQKQETFSKLGKLIAEHHPLSLDNKSLAQAFESGNPTDEDLANGLKAIKAIKDMAKWGKVTLESLTNATNIIQKELGVPAGKDNVIPFEQAKTKVNKKQEQPQGRVAA